jgi:hypothetical protein
MTGGGFEGHLILPGGPGGPAVVVPHNVEIVSSLPVANGWRASADLSDTGFPERLTVYAVCSPAT